jgi:hypothetical protein
MLFFSSFLFGQKKYEFRTANCLSEKSIKEFYTLQENGEFVYTIRIRGLSISFESHGFWKQINKDSILLNSTELDVENINRSKIGYYNPQSTYNIEFNKSIHTSNIEFDITGQSNFKPYYSIIYFTNGHLKKVDTLSKNVTLNEVKIDSFYIIDLNTGIASENYYGLKNACKIRCIRQSTRVFKNEYISRAISNQWISPTSYWGKSHKKGTLELIN